MKKILVTCFAIISITSTYAQNSTIGDVEQSIESYQASVLIIPFESKMYISDIDKDLALKNELNFQDIKAKFRAALDRELFIALKKYYKPISFYSIEPQEAIQELAYIYNSIGYKYEVVSIEEVVKKENVGTKLVGKMKKKPKEEEYIEAGIQNGEVVSQVDNREKYMKTTLPNEKLLPSLNEKYKVTHYVFINELDIKKAANDVYQASEEQYQREIKVHYTIFDSTGKEVSSGAIKSRFESEQNDIDKIIKVQFPMIAEKIVTNLLGPDAIK
ncbi:MAG: hypothetical protein CO118_10735 [Flavobacteriales bacterium CG_4_9_14_3_um_filter_32_8]|nr:MAG: hypothetical protein CO118_10735 [Flavobacteriales bacterium CG_4_9_14_3_um_filter_32_8]